MRSIPKWTIRRKLLLWLSSGWRRQRCGTLLVLTESGFEKIPGDRRLEAFRRNDGGWAEQMKNIENTCRANVIARDARQSEARACFAALGDEMRLRR